MPASAAQDDYDSPWKEAVEHAFPEFIDFCFPDAGRQIDWARGHRSTKGAADRTRRRARPAPC